MTRLKAAAIHLAVSAAIALTAVLFSVLVWYPGPLFDIMGGGHITGIMVGVDIVLGPLITLVIFNVKKPRRELITDYCVIGFIQIAALVYGIFILAQARPVYVVFVKDRFSVVRPSELHPVEPGKLKSATFATLPWTGPRWVIAVFPEASDERTKILDSALSGNGDIETMPQYFVPYEERAADVAKAARTLDELKKKRAEHSNRIDDATKGTAVEVGRLGYLPYVGKKRDVSVLIDKTSGAVLGFIDVDPW